MVHTQQNLLTAFFTTNEMVYYISTSLLHETTIDITLNYGPIKIDHLASNRLISYSRMHPKKLWDGN